MGLNYFTLVHILLSLGGIAAGIGVLAGLLQNQIFKTWLLWFFVLTFLTSFTGFFFPITGVTPAIIVGIISLVLLGGAAFAFYGKHLSGIWRSVFLIGALSALYLNVFVFIVQLFQRMPALHALAPQQSKPPFVLTQCAVLVAFIAFGYFTVKTVRRE